MDKYSVNQHWLDFINRINNNYNFINSTQIKVTTFVVWKLENENYASTYQDHVIPVLLRTGIRVTLFSIQHYALLLR